MIWGDFTESSEGSKIIDRFVMNDILWRVRFVESDSPYLIDRTNTLRVATTDFGQQTIFLSNKLSGEFLRTVFVHELGHVTMFSYNLIPAIHSFVKPSRWIEAEEWVCNFIADYGDEVFEIANYILEPFSFSLISGKKGG